MKERVALVHGNLDVVSEVGKGPRVQVVVVMEFKDTGAGMSRELQKAAFKTVLATTKAKGSGLGLAIVGRIIETHHGQIRVRSRLGHGTTIQISLPMK